ncbi:response regulator [Dyadobacter bucti]|uniref:response regulator n=1 Tax=Dyadobacter bucti TaxID=2572203 RepID=UPI001108FDF2|nr:response regulator [Dyadobacter bucti]
MENSPIVIADDDQDDSVMMAEAFSKVLFNQNPVIQVPGAKELLSLISEIVVIPKIFIVDMIMPCFDGIDVLARLKTTNDLSNVPVVLFSSNRFNLDLAYQAGADAFYSKPVDPDGFLLIAADIKRLFLE